MIALNSRQRSVNKLAKTSLSVVTVGGKMVFPDVPGSVAVVLDLFGDDGEESRVLKHALSMVGLQGASEAMYVDAVLPNGARVALISSHGSLPAVLSVGDTLVFAPSQRELCDGLAVGDEVTMEVRLPETFVDVPKGSEKTVVWIDGIKIITATWKGQKKGVGNADFFVYSEPSGVELQHFKDFIAGHSRGEYWTNRGALLPAPGETALRGKVLEWSGFYALMRFAFPARSLEMKTTIIDIQRL